MTFNPTNLNTFGAIIITGASSGIGFAVLAKLLKACPNLLTWSISRSKPDHGVGVATFQHISADLSAPVEVRQAFYSIANDPRFQSANGPVLLINNAGFGVYGRFGEDRLKATLEMIDLNVRAVVEGTGILWPTLEKKGGVVINVASTAAFQPTPYMAAYGATKAFLLNWTTAVQEEIRARGEQSRLRMVCLCPGPTETQFFTNAGLGGTAPESTRWLNQAADEVAGLILREAASGSGSSLVVSGWKNRLLTSLSSPFPTRFKARMAETILKHWRIHKA